MQNRVYMATNEEYQALIKALSSECEFLHEQIKQKNSVGYKKIAKTGRKKGKMAFSDKAKSTKYINDFMKEKYDRIVIIRPKGQKETLKKLATENGVSVNEFINGIINAYMVDHDIKL